MKKFIRIGVDMAKNYFKIQALASEGGDAVIVMKDVGGQADLVTGCGNRLDHGREQRITTTQQPHGVAATEDRPRHHVPQLAERRSRGRFSPGRRIALGHQSSCSSATSGRWSDMRAHALPRGTCRSTQRSPRV